MFSSPISKRLDVRGRPQVEQLEDRIALNHAPITPELPVNITPVSFSPPVAVAADAQGDFVVVWARMEEGGTDIVARRYDRDGVPRPEGEITVASGINGPESEGFEPVTLDVAMAPDGSFVVVYDLSVQGSATGTVDPGVFEVLSVPDIASEVRAAFYDTSGAFVTQTDIAPDPQLPFGRNLQPSVALDSQGNAVVAFLSDGFSGGETVAFARLSKSGTLLDTDPVAVSTANTPALSRPAVGRDGAGNFVVAWNADRGSNGEIVFRRFDASGTPLDNPEPVDVSAAPFDAAPTVGKARDTGAFVISWADDESLTVNAQRFDAAGNALGSIFNANTDLLAAVNSASVAVAADGDFVITWTTGLSTTVSAHVYNADGSPESAVLKVNQATADTGPVDVATDNTLHQFVVTWAALESDTESPPLVVARVYRAPDPPKHDQPRVDPDPDLPFIDFTEPREPAPQTRTILFDPTLRVEQVTPFVSVTPRAPLSSPLTLNSSSERVQKLGEISGLVFLDLNGNGILDDGEEGLAGQRVFLDMNDNGIQDEDEPGMDTDANGRYQFTGLALSRYRVRQNLRSARVAQTLPERNRAHVVELTAENSSVPGRDFGARIIRVPIPVSGGTRTQSAEDSQPTPPEPAPASPRD